DILDSHSELVEGDTTTLQNCGRIDRGLDATRDAVQQPNLERVLQRSNRLRHGRLRQTKRAGCLGHTAVLDYGEQNMQVPQRDPATDSVLPVKTFSHQFF